MEFLQTRLADVYETVEPWNRPGTQVVVGHAYVYDLAKIRTEAAAARVHLDAWLTCRVASLFHVHHPKRPCLLFFSLGTSPEREFVRLTLSERSGSLQGSWLSEISGFFELGKEALPSNASLWASWDGTVLSRVHDFLDGSPSGLMVTDIGGMPGISIFTDVSEEDYESMKNDPIERWDYSPIPRDFIECINSGGGDALRIRHLAFQSIPPDAFLDEEANEDPTDIDAGSAGPVSPERETSAASAVELGDLINRIADRSTRAAAIVEACERRQVGCIPAIIDTLKQLTWAEVGPVRDALPVLAPAIVQPLIDLLSSNRKQTAEIVTGALGKIGDPKTCFPLLEMMEQQSGTANAIRARDALIVMGEAVVPGLIFGLDFAGWETRLYTAQALGAIGASAALDRLREAAQSDRSAKVRDAALEAIRSIEAGSDV